MKSLKQCMKRLPKQLQWISDMVNQYILEAKYLDKINRVKRKTIVGVFKDLESIEEIKSKMISEEKDYKLAFSINGQFNPFLQRVSLDSQP